MLFHEAEIITSTPLHAPHFSKPIFNAILTTKLFLISESESAPPPLGFSSNVLLMPWFPHPNNGYINTCPYRCHGIVMVK